MKSMSTLVRGVLALAAAATLAACQNPVSAGAHITPEGFALLEGSTTLVTGTGGQSQPTVTGNLSVGVGQQRTLSVRFTDAGGAVMLPPSGYYIDVVTTGAAGIATWQPATDGLSGTLTGVAAGTTTLRFSWMHGPPGAGHAETGWNVNVIVDP
jgi:hypothetical protein